MKETQQSEEEDLFSLHWSTGYWSKEQLRGVVGVAGVRVGAVPFVSVSVSAQVVGGGWVGETEQKKPTTEIADHFTSAVAQHHKGHHSPPLLPSFMLEDHPLSQPTTPSRCPVIFS